MKTVQLREAKARLSALVEAAVSGEPTTITRHGKPAAMLVPLSAARKIYPQGKPSFADWLLSIPHEIPFERDQTPPRKVEF
ncbi:MAG TPA: type II toxin-antitoxin system Phd/YefM family antitoxin [Propylenella sp.]